MYDRILVPLDGSELAEGITPQVTEIAKKFDSEVILLQSTVAVAEAFASATGADAARTELAAAAKSAQDYLDTVAKRFESEGIKARTHLATGKAARAIADYAKEADVSLIAMSTHGRSGPDRIVFGSVAEGLVRSSPVPVLICPC